MGVSVASGKGGVSVLDPTIREQMSSTCEARGLIDGFGGQASMSLVPSSKWHGPKGSVASDWETLKGLPGLPCSHYVPLPTLDASPKRARCLLVPKMTKQPSATAFNYSIIEAITVSVSGSIR